MIIDGSLEGAAVHAVGTADHMSSPSELPFLGFPVFRSYFGAHVEAITKILIKSQRTTNT